MMISIFNIKATTPREVTNPLFNDKITELTEKDKALAVYNVLVKNSIIGLHQMIMSKEKRVLAEKELFSKFQYLNISKLVEAIVLLKIVQIIYNKSKHIQYGGVKNACYG